MLGVGYMGYMVLCVFFLLVVLGIHRTYSFGKIKFLILKFLITVMISSLNV